MGNTQRRKHEVIHEKTICEFSDEDLEDGIYFVPRRRSDSDVCKISEDVCEDVSPEEINIHAKRKAYARKKSISLDSEALTKMLQDVKFGKVNGGERREPKYVGAPVIVTTDTSQENQNGPIIPKQADGLLQVGSFNYYY